MSKPPRKTTMNSQEGNLVGSLTALFTTAYPQHEIIKPIKHNAIRKKRYAIFFYDGLPSAVLITAPTTAVSCF